MLTICVVGLGYIGLPTAAMLASRGHQVVGYDVNASAVASINSGKPHFHEPDLQMLLAAAVNTGQFRAQTEPSAADYFIISVPTPIDSSKKPDLSCIDAACDAIAPYLSAGNTIILESTSPVGTTERMCERIGSLRGDLRMPRYKDDDADHDIYVCHCPERVLPGRMLQELVANDRIVGGMTESCSQKAASLYETFVTSNILVTDCRTAEFVKLIENAYRDVNIAFANELSLVCEWLDINVWKAIGLANQHPRVNILRPGPGVGGHCIAVDPWFIIASAPDHTPLMRAARDINDGKPHTVVERVRKAAWRLKDPVVACCGLTYKPDVDDLRESPSLHIVEELAGGGNMTILACDPHIREMPPALAASGSVQLVDLQTALREADIVVMLVSHKEFRRIEPNLLLNKIVIDTIGLCGPA